VRPGRVQGRLRRRRIIDHRHVDHEPSLLPTIKFVKKIFLVGRLGSWNLICGREEMAGLLWRPGHDTIRPARG
jgi:hypothetical protein